METMWVTLTPVRCRRCTVVLPLFFPAVHPDSVFKLGQKGLTADEVVASLGVNRNGIFRYFRQASA